MLGLTASHGKRRSMWLAGAVALILCAAPARTSGQAAVEYGGAASHSAMSAMAASKAAPAASPTPATPGSSPFLTVPAGPPIDETNRKALEQRAGKDAGKLLLQSIPSEAQIDIDGNMVGRTPLLLIIPPGKYKVEMRGAREEFGERLVELLPNETQKIALTLAVHYPAGATAHMAPASSFVQGSAAGSANLYTTGQQATPESSAPSLATPEGLSAEEAQKLAAQRESRYPSNVSAHPRTAASSVAGSAAGAEISYPPAAAPLPATSADAQKLAVATESRYPSSVSAHPKAASPSNGGVATGTQTFSPAATRPAEELNSSSPALTEPPASPEAEKLALALEARYPSNISAHPTTATGGTAGGVEAPSAASQLALADTGAAPPAATEEIAAAVNRKALEQSAGRDAAKLVLQSVPGAALAYIDGRFVGRTPVQLTVAPGKYKVEMSGEHEATGERLVGVLPNETQQIEISLASNYPASISIQ